MADTASELARLKDLLLRPEADRLEKLQAQVGGLEDRLGTRERLEHSTAEILVDAFRQAEVRQHRELARAVAPVVVAAIQSEIRNSRDMMVEALYPITGRLVAAAVADAFRSLVAGINQRVDTMMSMRLWRLRIQSWITRRPLSELLLSQASRPHLRRLLFLERGSGTLLGSWTDAPDDNDRSDLVSGMIAAITEFSANVFEHDSGELRTLDMGASRILLQSSARSIIAGEFSGTLHPQDEVAVHEEFARLAAANTDGKAVSADDIDASALLLAALARDAEEKKSGKLGIWIVAALALALACYFGWRTWTRIQFEHEVRRAFDATAAARQALKAYPISLSIDHDAQAIRLSGLTPSADDANALRSAIQKSAGSFSLASDIAVVVDQDAAAKAIADAREQTATAQTAFRSFAAAQENSLADLNAEIAKLRAALQEQQPVIANIDRRALELSASVNASIADLQKITSDPRDLAERLITRTAIFFDRDAVLKDPDSAGKALDALANALKKAKVGVRIVGYSSETGSGQTNRRIAQERAAAIAALLIERGIAKELLVTAARPALLPIDDAPDGAGNSNRRVTFESLFDHENVQP